MLRRIGMDNSAKITYAFVVVLSLGACRSSVPSELKLAWEEAPEVIDFNFHIRPILSDRCYPCHGPDDNKREANLRLDQEDSSFGSLEHGGRAIVGGSLAQSLSWQRIISADPNYMMPPPESHLVLTPEEKVLIGKWIKQGAEWKDHWAFIPPVRPKVPVAETALVQNEIDPFILQTLTEHGLEPSPAADKERLIRRVTMDLTGLPPTLTEIDAFVQDGSADAYDKLVDRLLDTDAHAERLAVEWLDVARYGDTQGLHTDAERRYWPWRDWVIGAFKDHVPYDEFITHQMAGDLLPQPTRDQKLATAFHRLHPMSSEGGIPNEEYRQKYVQDRTNTTATAFLGLTLECASCHDHKFDPISQREYYGMTAFFNKLPELGLVNEATVDDPSHKTKHSSGPVLLLPDSAQQKVLQHIDEELQQISKQKSQMLDVPPPGGVISSADIGSMALSKPVKVLSFESLQGHRIEEGVVHRIQNNRPIDKMVDRDPQVLACGDPEVMPGKLGNSLRSPKEMDIVFVKHVGDIEAYDTYSAGAWIRFEKEGENQSIMGNSGAMGNGWRGWDFYLDTLNRLSLRLVSMLPHNYLEISGSASLEMNVWHHVFFTYDGSSDADGVKLFVDGRQLKTSVHRNQLYGTIKRRWRPRREWPSRPLMVFRSGRYHTGENGVFKGSIDQVRFYDEEISPLEIAALYIRESGEAAGPILSVLDRSSIKQYQLKENPQLVTLNGRMRALLKERIELMKVIPDIMVMSDDRAHHRKTFVLDRGQYDQPTIQVKPSIPEVLGTMSDTLPRNRLGLAKWMVNPSNPITARVAVNRYWQMIFGRGLVETTHDFGIQGALPSHPALLDWLAIEFMESGWDLRALLRKMVLSRTYRQSSTADSTHMAVDPTNIWLARAPSYRLPAEMIRDNALASSGLLVSQVGGPSVKPYQPDGIWDFGSLVTGNYVVGEGADLYRRSMYTYIRRTSPHPTMVAFDAPNRLVCTAKRENTNTPLQALALLNDPQFVEASRVLAERMMLDGGVEIEDKLAFGFRLICGRRPTGKEIDILTEQYQAAKLKYQHDQIATKALLSIGAQPVQRIQDHSELAALTLTASTMMNFDEAYMKR